MPIITKSICPSLCKRALTTAVSGSAGNKSFFASFFSKKEESSFSGEKEESSFSEEKEAKRLLFLAASASEFRAGVEGVA
jgi:hypothetical protein